jgi:hypothetical protein
MRGDAVTSQRELDKIHEVRSVIRRWSEATGEHLSIHGKDNDALDAINDLALRVA